MTKNVLSFHHPSESANKLAALAWYGWQTAGRGVVVMNVKPTGDSDCYYLEKDSPKLDDLWGDDKEELDGMMEQYDPCEGFVVLIAYDGIGDEARHVILNSKAPSYLKPPVAFERFGVG